MNQPVRTPEERYDALVEALCVGGKIFAMLAGGRLVVKLPRQQVDVLVASGDGQRFDPGHGRLMKEWLSLEPASMAGWLPLAGLMQQLHT